MRRPHGYFYGSADAEHGRAFEADSLMCPHCNAHFAVVPNATPAQLGQFCTNCMAQCCVKPSCNSGCRPFMKAIEAAEAKMRLRALVCLIVLLLASSAFAQPHATVLADRILTGHGNGEFVPRFVQFVPQSLTVPVGETVTLSGAVTHGAIEVAGTYRCTGSASLSVITIYILPGGTLDANCTGLIVFRDVPIDTARDPYQFGNGLINMGTLRLAGPSRGAAFASLTAGVSAGATTVALNVPSAWKVGDEVLVTDTAQQAPGVRPRRESRVFIAAKTATSLTLSKPLDFEHLPVRDPEGVIKHQATVANLSRDLVVMSDNPLGTRGHIIMLGHEATWDVQGVEFADLGRTKATTLHSTTANTAGAITQIGTNQVGRYTFHVHHTHGVGTVFRGNVLVDQGQTKWGHATHATHDTTVEDNIAVGFVGSGFITEDGYEVRNVYRRNFAAYIAGNGKGAAENVDPPSNNGINAPGSEGAGFWLHGTRQTVDANESWNNHVGFQLLYRGQVWGRIPSVAGGPVDTDFDPTQAYPVSFDGNKAIANTDAGWEMWQAPRTLPLQVIATNLHIANSGRSQVFTGIGAEGSLRIQGLFVYAQNGQSIGVEATVAYTRHVVIEGGEIRGTAIGVMDAADLVELHDVTLQNVLNVRFEQLPHGARFVGVTHRPLGTHPLRTFEITAYATPWNGQLPLPERDFGGYRAHTDNRFTIVNWQGTGQDYRLYSGQSAANRPAFPATLSEGQTWTPVQGLTMGESWNRFGMAYGGGTYQPSEVVTLEGMTNVFAKPGLTPNLGPPRAVVTWPVAHEPATVLGGDYLVLRALLTGQRVGTAAQFRFDGGAWITSATEDWPGRDVFVKNVGAGVSPGPHTIESRVLRADGTAVVGSETVFTYAVGGTTTPPGEPPPPPPPAEVCGDGLDNDLDGQVDEGCVVEPPPPTGTVTITDLQPASGGTASSAQTYNTGFVMSATVTGAISVRLTWGWPDGSTELDCASYAHCTQVGNVYTFTVFPGSPGVRTWTFAATDSVGAVTTAPTRTVTLF